MSAVSQVGHGGGPAHSLRSSFIHLIIIYYNGGFKLILLSFALYPHGGTIYSIFYFQFPQPTASN
jgi:hypothetical protein